MKVIRTGVFETNSSSCHSISITKDEIWQELTEIAERQAELYSYLREMEQTGENFIDREEWK